MANDTITINTRVLPYPSKFSMSKVPNIVSEYTTMTGNTRADVNGWKYADTTLSWGAMWPDDFDTLIAAVQADCSFQVIFHDPTSTAQTTRTITVNAINRGLNFSKMRYQNDGRFVYEDVSLSLSFPDCYAFS